MDTHQEYNATPVKARNCYSNIFAYGSQGQIEAIVNPQPVSIVPQLFWYIPQDRIPKYVVPESTSSTWYTRNCKTYSTQKTLNDQPCEEF